MSWGGKGSFHPTGYSLPWMEAKAGTQDRSLKQKPQSNAVHWFARSPLIASFLKQLRTTFVRMNPSTVGWATSAQLGPGKCPVDMPRHHSAGGNLQLKYPLFNPFSSVTTNISHRCYIGLPSAMSSGSWALPISHVCSENWCHQSYLSEAICSVTFYITAWAHATP